jgi:hypothetical protein
VAAASIKALLASSVKLSAMAWLELNSKVVSFSVSEGLIVCSFLQEKSAVANSRQVNAGKSLFVFIGIFYWDTGWAVYLPYL